MAKAGPAGNRLRAASLDEPGRVGRCLDKARSHPPFLGVHSHGQGMETTFAQIANEILGIDVARIKVVHGDTGLTPFSTGTYASRSLVMSGGAVSRACKALLPRLLKIGIKFGPMSARFEGAARLQRDDSRKRGVLKGAGQDSLSNSKAAGDIAYQLTARSASETEVAVDLQYSLQGPLAQFSRSGLVRDFVRRMIADFGKSVARRMDPTLSESERMRTVELNPVALFFSVLWERMKRLLGLGGH